MVDKTAIEWADSTLNLWIGCTKISPACDNCYAEALGRRFGVVWGGELRKTGPASWSKFAAYQRGAARFAKIHGRPRRVFVNSMSDFFDNQAQQDWRNAAYAEMEAAPDVIFILVTKRPQLVRRFAPTVWTRRGGWPKNVWLLVTAENQLEYERRVAHALTVPGKPLVGVSMEPMLADINPGLSVSGSDHDRATWAGRILKQPVQATAVNRLRWVIVGGESGRKARYMPPLDIVADRVLQFQNAGVAVFVKQLSQADRPDTFKDHATFPRRLQQRMHP